MSVPALAEVEESSTNSAVKADKKIDETVVSEQKNELSEIASIYIDGVGLSALF